MAINTVDQEERMAKAKAKSRGRVGNDEARMLRAGLALLNVELLKGGEAKTASVAGTNFYFLTEIRLGIGVT